MGLGPLISAGASILGGLFGSKSQKDSIEAQMDAQKEFAQEGIRWRVKDAKLAGIHPLYAMGANTPSFSPIGIPGDPLAEGIASAGQDIGRAVAAKQTVGERAFTDKMQALQLQRGELENALLASQLRTRNGPGLPPPMPNAVSGQSSTPGSVIDGQNIAPVATTFLAHPPGSPVVNAPMEVIRDAGGQAEPTSVAARGFSKVGPGEYQVIPSADFKQRAEDMLIPELAWGVREFLAPYKDPKGVGNPPYPAPAGYTWKWNPAFMTYMLRPQSGKGARIRKLPANY